MKQIIFRFSWLLLAFTFLQCNDQNDNEQELTCDFTTYRYVDGNSEPLGEPLKDYIMIGIDTTYTDSEIENFISGIEHFDQTYNYRIHHLGQYKYKTIPLKLNSPKSCEEITLIISELEEYEIIGYAHFTMDSPVCINLIGEPLGNLCVVTYGNNFYIRVFDINDLTHLNQMAYETNTEIVEQITVPNWFELRATKNSTGNAIAMANYFYETGYFDNCAYGFSLYPVE